MQRDTRGYNVRYEERTPRATPRMEAPQSMPPPNVRSMREVDGRAFGAYHNQVYPPMAVERREIVVLGHAGGRRCAWQGVDDGFYDLAPLQANASALSLTTRGF